ncbi:MAG: hypothetical protein IPK26_04185 [Planctomycetes bacterium]|nr:hypothetical protein [Planctomycetota bacterium]
MQRHHRILCTVFALAAIAAAIPAQTVDRIPSTATPLWFEPMPEGPQFHARGAAGLTFQITGDRMIARAHGQEIRLTIVGARPDAALEPQEPRPSVSNYYFGREPALWRAGVPHFGRLLARNVRRGVDVVWRSHGRELEFDLIARPDADLDRLRLRVEHTDQLPRLSPDGAVLLPLAGGELRLQPPFVFQERAGRREAVQARYRLDGADIRFEFGARDPALDLVIDPVVTFSTLLGGGGNETGVACAVDNQGNMAVTGATTSTDFPLRNPLPGTLAGVQTYVSKFDRQGNLVFSTWFGGTGLPSTTPVDIGFDPQGLVVFGGNTNSPSLPVTPGVVQPLIGASSAWFFAALQPSGTLSWCTYYAGGGTMRALHVLDVLRGSVIGVGNGLAPLMPNAYSGAGNIAVAGIFGGNVLWVSTQCGFSGTPTAIDVTANGHICITGSTQGVGLPTTAQSFQRTPPGSLDGFVLVFFGTANSLVFCTYLGGSSNDVPRRIRAVSGPGTVHCTIAGETNSDDLPLAGAVQTQRRGSTEAFVARLNGNMSGLDFLTYFGGSFVETVAGLALDSSGGTVFGGSSTSLDLPLRDALRTPVTGVNQDAYLARLSPDGRTLIWSTTFGGGNNDLVHDLAMGPSREIVIAGTSGQAFPTTPNALPSPGSNDAFLVQFADTTLPSYGTSTAGYWGYPPRLAGGGSRAQGGVAVFNIHDGRSQALGLLAIGFGRAQVPFGNGFLWTVPSATLTLQLRGMTGAVWAEAGGGHLQIAIAIPASPVMTGLVTDWQAFFLDAAAVGGATMTNGVELVVQ